MVVRWQVSLSSVYPQTLSAMSVWVVAIFKHCYFCLHSPWILAWKGGCQPRVKPSMIWGCAQMIARLFEHRIWECSCCGIKHFEETYQKRLWTDSPWKSSSHLSFFPSLQTVSCGRLTTSTFTPKKPSYQMGYWTGEYLISGVSGLISLYMSSVSLCYLF